MELTNILKIQFNNLKKILIIFLSCILFISLILFIPFNDTIKYYIGSFTLFCAIVFTAFIAASLYGSFGKTYAFLQNNRFIYSLSIIIWNITLSLIMLLLFTIMRIAIIKSGFNFKFVCVIIGLFISTFNLSCCYSLYFRYQKIFRKVLLILVVIRFLFFNKYVMGFISNVSHEILTEQIISIALFKLNPINYILIVLGLNVIINFLNLIYYSNFNIIKSLP
ncbi:MAG: hypothetical protein SOU07_00690 [Bacilli bacterium]|nr:hypothetical protein [Bacilli bacterium]